MPNSIDYVRNYTAILDEVYQRASVSGILNSPSRMKRSRRNAREIMIPKIEVSGLGDYTRNVGYKTGSINYEFETKTFNCDRGIRLFADVNWCLPQRARAQRPRLLATDVPEGTSA